MVHIIDLPNNQTAEFPDDMSLDQISSIIRKQFPPTSQQPNTKVPDENSGMVNTAIGQLKNLNSSPLFNKEDIGKMINEAALATPASSALGGFQKLAANNPLIKRSLGIIDKPVTGAAIGVVGNPEHPVEGGLTGGAIGGLLGSIPGGINAIKYLGNLTKNAFQKISPTQIGKTIQERHDNLLNQASSLFNEVSNVAKDRNIGQVDIDPKFLDKITKQGPQGYFPDTRATTKLIEDAKQGNYSALRKLQSELWQRGSAKKSSIIPSEHDLGEEMLDNREILNEKIINHFKKNKHFDLAKKLNEAKDIYRDLKDIYYSHGTISKLVDPSIRKIPKNLLSVLSEDSIPMKKLKDSNPFIYKELQNKINKKNAINKLKTIGKYSAAGTGIGLAAGIPVAYNKFKGE